jgi:predicted AlkP superfamily phosphohydrolase/phosphomutase
MPTSLTDSPGRANRAAVLLVLVLAVLLGVSAAPAKSVPNGRVVILGFDGADGRTLEQLMQAGELPNFAALRDTGTYAPLLSSAPPESPVAWASLNSGRNPAKTGVASFFVRELDEYGKPQPTFGHLVDQQGANAPPIDTFEHTPLPRFALRWSRGQFAALCGGAVALGFGFLFLLLLRMRPATGIVIALLLGGVSGYGAWKMRAYVPERVPRYGNPMQAESFWNTAAKAGKRAIVLEAAQAFDEPRVDGAEVLYGLGVPDAKGGLGDWAVYTTSEDEVARAPEGRPTLTAGRVYRVDERGGVIRSQVLGPVNFWERARVDAEIEALTAASAQVGYKRSLEINAQIEALRARRKELSKQPTHVELVATRSGADWKIRLGEREETLAEGQWSDFYPLSFPINPKLSVRAVTRCKLVRAADPFELFLDVLHIDPAAPPFWQPITNPFGYASQLARANGAFETYGWACATMPLKDGEIDEQTFVDDIEFTLRWREKMTYGELERGGFDVLMSVLSETDRVQHMLYHHYDPEHPQHDAAQAARSVRFFGQDVPLSRMIPEVYRQADRVVGEVRKRLRPDDTLLICSDHGFQSFRTQVHVNNWLIEHGYLALKPGLTPSRENDSNLNQYADWSKTRAYGMGLGFIYVNEQGREAAGIVAPEDKDALLDALERDWLAARDANDRPLCSAVYRPARLFEGDFGARLPDLILGFAPPYHVSWASGGGGLGLADSGSGLGPTTEPNTSPWSGDHTSMDLASVRGIFLSNRAFTLPTGGPDLRHVAPTVLALLGVAIPADCDLAPLPLR